MLHYCITDAVVHQHLQLQRVSESSTEKALLLSVDLAIHFSVEDHPKLVVQTNRVPSLVTNARHI